MTSISPSVPQCQRASEPTAIRATRPPSSGRKTSALSSSFWWVKTPGGDDSVKSSSAVAYAFLASLIDAKRVVVAGAEATGQPTIFDFAAGVGDSS